MQCRCARTGIQWNLGNRCYYIALKWNCKPYERLSFKRLTILFSQILLKKIFRAILFVFLFHLCLATCASWWALNKEVEGVDTKHREASNNVTIAVSLPRFNSNILLILWGLLPPDITLAWIQSGFLSFCLFHVKSIETERLNKENVNRTVALKFSRMHEEAFVDFALRKDLNETIYFWLRFLLRNWRSHRLNIHVKHANMYKHKVFLKSVTTFSTITRDSNVFIFWILSRRRVEIWFKEFNKIEKFFISSTLRELEARTRAGILKVPKGKLRRRREIASRVFVFLTK